MDKLCDKVKKMNNINEMKDYVEQELIKTMIIGFLDYYKINLNYKDFVTLIAINYFPMNFIIHNKEHYNLINKLVQNINKKQKISNWEQIYDILKTIEKDNEDEISIKYVTIYYNLCMMLNDVNDERIVNEKNKYYNLLKNIKKEKTDEYIILMTKNLTKTNTYEQFSKEVVFNKIDNDIKQDDFSSILKLIDVIRIKLCNMTPNRNDLINEINENLNISFIKHKIDNNIMDLQDIKKLFHFIIRKIKDYQCSNNDNEFKEYCLKLSKEENIVIILKCLIEKIEEIENDIKKFKESIKKNNS